MARYIYDEKQVGATISTINEAIEELEEVNIKIKKGINTISSARGGEYINIEAEPILEYKTIVVDSIEALVSTIREKVALIEEYNNASWGEKAFSTISMGVTKFVEGLATAGEQIVDGFATITGFVVGIFSEDAKNEIGEFIKKDHVGDFFESAYDTGFLSSVEKYSAFSSQSTMANVFKGFGVATGYIGVAALTGGASTAISGGSFAAGATAATQSIGLNTVLAGMGGMGSGTQEGLQSGLSYNEATLKGIKRGAIQAGTVFLAGKATEKISNAISNRATTRATSHADSTALETVANSADDVFRLPPSSTENVPLLGSGVDDIASTAAKAGTSSVDDVASAAINSTDDIAKGITKYNSLDEFKTAVNSGKYKGNLSALNKDYVNSFGIPKDGSVEHTVLAEAINVARGKATVMDATAHTSYTPGATTTAATAAEASTSTAMSVIGDRALSTTVSKVVPVTSSTVVSQSAAKAGANIIPGVVASVGGEQAYWMTKNQTASQSLSDYDPINIGDPSVSSTYEATPDITPPVEPSHIPDNPQTTPGITPPVEPSHIPDNPQITPSTIPSGTNDGKNNVSTPISSVVSASSELSSGYLKTGSTPNVGDNFNGNYLNNSPNATIDSYNTTNSTTTTNNYHYNYNYGKEKDNLNNNVNNTDNLNNNVDDNVNNTDKDNLKTIIGVGLGTVGSAFVAYGAKKAIDKKKENDEI